MKIVLFFAALLATATITLGQPVLAASQDSFDPLATACANQQVKQSNNSICKDSNKTTSKTNPAIWVIANATKIISLIAAFIAVIMIVVSGINMITSGGNAENVTSARKRLTGAVVGLIVASLAWVLSSFVVNQIL